CGGRPAVSPPPFPIDNSCVHVVSQRLTQPDQTRGGGAMHARLSRPGALIASCAMLVSACGSGPSPSQSVTASQSGSAPASAAAPPSPTPSTAPATLPPGPVTLTWFCCLGGGDEESQQKTFQELAKTFEASHPDIKIKIDHTA